MKTTTLTKSEQRTKTALSNLIQLNHPVAMAVEPLRGDAIKRTEEHARKTVESVRNGLDEAGWDMNKYAPYPSTREHGYGLAYEIAMTRYRLVSGLVKWLQATGRPGQPCPVEMSLDKVEHYIEECKERAALDYDAFIVKLCEKIGACTAAVMTGEHAWGNSRLTVTKPTSVEVWQTKQIINQSKLGKLFNQWPSRKVKGN